MILSFHKKIHGAVILSEEKYIPRILSAKEDINELIF
jgi:hypothetical protein